jgi:tetratricopeptide (TPR) repeat protein
VGETAAAHNDLGWLYINGRNAFYKEAEAQPGYLDLAEQQFAAAIRIQPDYWDAHASLGYALFQNGKFREAVDVLEPAVEHDSTNRDLLRELGSAYASQCRFDDAHSSFVAAYRNYKAARDENNMRNTLTDWGKVLDEFGLRNAAMAQENEVLHADPNHIYARQFLGQIEVADASSSVVAAGVESLRKAVEADADKHDFVLESYLDGLLKAGKHKTAIGVYEKWSKSGLVPPLAQSPSNGALAPPNQHVRLSYARALLQDGQTERALGQFEISERISIFPNVSDVSVLREQLRAGSTSPAIERRIGELAKFAIPVPLPHRCVAPTISTAKGLKGLTIH